MGTRRRCGEELLDGLGGERVAMPAPDERDSFAVAEHGFAPLVGYEHRLGQGVECPAEPDGLGTRFCDGFDSTVGRALQEDEHFLEVVCVSWGRVRAKPRRERLQSLSQPGSTPASCDQPRRRDENDHHDDGYDELENRHV